jgi:pimeloyl-ACP methyl ester carboxylesterase
VSIAMQAGKVSPMREFLEINGASIWVEQAGTGPDIVLIHAGIADSRMWDPQWDVLPSVTRVTRFDLRGFGKSSLPPEPYAHHEDVEALLGHLGIERAVLVGASYGGNVAVELALEHPERVSGLVLVNSLVGSTTRSADLLEAWKHIEEAMESGDLDRATELELRLWVDGPHRTAEQVDPGVRELVRTMDRALLARVPEQEAAAERNLEPPAHTRLAEIAAPVLVVVGTLDQPEALLSADALVTHVPNARRVDIEGAAHLPSLEQADVFNRILLDFLHSA